MDLNDLMEKARGQKEVAARLGQDFVSFLMIFRDGKPWGIVPYGNLEQPHRAVGAAVTCSGSDPVVLVNDAYTTTVDRGGDLETRFLAGDADVTEAVMVMMAHKDGTNGTLIAPYRIVDGRVVWGEVSEETSAEGRYAETLATAWALHEEGVRLFGEELIKDWPRMLPEVLAEVGVEGLVLFQNAGTVLAEVAPETQN